MSDIDGILGVSSKLFHWRLKKGMAGGINSVVKIPKSQFTPLNAWDIGNL